MESSSTQSQSSAPQSFVSTNPNLIDTSSEAREHDESNASSTDDRSDHDSRASEIPTPEGETSGTYTPSQLLMAIFVAVVVFLILAVYQGILYIPGAHPITAALATVSICTAITSQPSFLGRFIYLILYAIGFMAKILLMPTWFWQLITKTKARGPKEE
ncbi:uncharacterized protein J4E87_009624 [Alternaria ethzedia]|uniref:uncharacterized protein n=1 Tax=Alternaria ethzedia TaxID=181014 RepID=UPI0020C38F85|nr:uncharacterized protein J4E87_009624 [Alternaria ethzedia]KAI4614227.1 hypothetical protein J4E87_009624 [Alternaria ethzedia]